MARVDDLYNEGEKLKDEGKLEEAAAKFRECLEEDEASVLAHLALAVVYGKTGRHDEAVQHARRALELEPDDPFNYMAMSVTYQRAFAGTQNPEYIRLAEEAMARGHALRGGF